MRGVLLPIAVSLLGGAPAGCGSGGDTSPVAKAGAAGVTAAPDAIWGMSLVGIARGEMPACAFGKELLGEPAKVVGVQAFDDAPTSSAGRGGISR